MENTLKALVCSIAMLLAFGGIFSILYLVDSFIGRNFVVLAAIILGTFFCSLIHFKINDRHK
ncbi:hypothetical protein P5641_00400 (plasmid) [Bacillus subtilis]|nr:hypothetical protein [Bacillus spizizenii]WEY94534.1 hypothetical protein P5641_00400 [Bacillus subtilis]